MIFKNYYDYCKKTNKSYVRQLWKHSFIKNKIKIYLRKLKCYIFMTEYEPYPNPIKNDIIRQSRIAEANSHVL